MSIGWLASCGGEKMLLATTGDFDLCLFAAGSDGVGGRVVEEEDDAGSEGGGGEDLACWVLTTENVTLDWAVVATGGKPLPLLSLDSSSENLSTGEYPISSSSAAEGGDSALDALGEYDGRDGADGSSRSGEMPYRSGDPPWLLPPPMEDGDGE